MGLCASIISSRSAGAPPSGPYVEQIRMMVRGMPYCWATHVHTDSAAILEKL